jgi:rSAM/selenodomain-associated transferase 1
VNLAVFLKQPRAGRVKTRLAQSLSGEEAAELYTAFLWDTVALATKSSAARVLLFHDGLAPSRFLPSHVWEPVRDRAREIPQSAGNLGDRLAAATAAAHREGQLPLLIVGSDSPDLPLDVLEKAMTALDGHDCVLGPADDGGVWCIGLARPVPGFFDDLPWSTEATGAALGNRARSLGLNLAEVDEWYDVDVLEDLKRLASRLLRGESKAKWTRRWLETHGRRHDLGL